MAGTKLTALEQEKATILTDAIAGRITNEQAAKQLGFSVSCNQVFLNWIVKSFFTCLAS